MRVVRSSPVVLAFAASIAAAAEIAGVHVPPNIEGASGPLVLNGAGVRSRAMFKVYVAALYLPQKASTPQDVLAQPARRIELHLLRNLSSGQLVDALREGLANNTSAGDLATIKPQTDVFIGLLKGFGDVKEGEVVALDFASNMTKVSLNGATKGSVAGRPFNDALMRIWLGDKPAQVDLEKALLGG